MRFMVSKAAGTPLSSDTTPQKTTPNSAPTSVSFDYSFRNQKKSNARRETNDLARKRLLRNQNDTSAGGPDRKGEKASHRQGLASTRQLRATPPQGGE